MPLSLALPMVPFLLQCHFYHVANFPRICKSHSTKTIKPKLSIVSMLANQWPLQNLSVPISVVNKMAKLRPCCPCTLVLCVRLTQALKCHPTPLPLLLPKYLTSYIYWNHRAPLLSSFTAVVVLSVALQQQQRQHLLSICGSADSGAHSWSAESETLGWGTAVCSPCRPGDPDVLTFENQAYQIQFKALLTGNLQ